MPSIMQMSWNVPEVVVPTVASKLAKEGINRASLAAGVANLLAVPFVLGMFPAYFWLLHAINLWVLIPLWYQRVIRKRRGQWFIVEPCWVLNCYMGVYFVATGLGVLPKELQLWAFRASFQVSLGFLSWSVLVSQNALIYHSVSTMAAIGIHLMPGLAFLTLRWQQEVGASVEEAWPGTFPSVADMAEHTRSAQLLLAGLVVYSVWWVLYLVWLLTIGVDLPGRGSPTIYGNFRRKHLKYFLKTGCKTERGQAVAYMFVHFALCTLSFCWALACWWFFYLHLVWFIVLLLFCIGQGADYYMREVLEKCAPAEELPPPPRPLEVLDFANFWEAQESPEVGQPPQRVMSMEEEYE